MSQNSASAPVLGASYDAPRSRKQLTRRTMVAMALWWVIVLALVAVAFRWGAAVQRDRPWVKLGAAPLVGQEEDRGWDLRLSAKTVPAALAILLSLVVTPRIARRARWAVVLITTALSAALVSLLLALMDGRDGVLAPVEHETEYWAYLPSTGPAREFVSSYIERLTFMPVHYRGHPPGYPLFLKLLAWVGFDGSWSVAIVSMLCTAIVPVAVLLTASRLADVSYARRAAPYFVVVPYTLWAMTSADIVFSALGAIAVLLAVLAAQRARFWVLAAIGGGITFGLLAHASYGAVMFSFVLLGALAAVLRGPQCLPGRQRVPLWQRLRPLVVPGALFVVGVVAVTLPFVVAGFWWLDGATATKSWYWKGTAKFRTWTYFSLANATVAFIAVGPAVVHALPRVDRRVRGVIYGGVVSMVVATVTQMTRGEVERIWLQFYPWVVVATGSLTPKRRVLWLVSQAVLTFVLGITLLSKW